MSDVVFARPDLPTIELAHGPWQVSVFDPRADGAALGARYVHGGYIAELRRDGRCLTGAAKPAWDSFNGIGMPETFEESLGIYRAQEGEEFLRIGAGRARKCGRGGPQHSAPLSATLNWTVTPMGATGVVMEVADGAVIDGKTFSYQLRRSLRLDAAGIVSETWLKVRCPWSHQLFWYPHPFFAGTSCDKIAYKLPANAHLGGGLKLCEDGLLRLPPAGHAALAATGLWGRRETVDVKFDASLGGGTIRIEPSYPLDKLVIWGSPCVSSIEPYWSRAWHDGEDATWQVSYRWLD